MIKTPRKLSTFLFIAFFCLIFFVMIDQIELTLLNGNTIEKYKIGLDIFNIFQHKSQLNIGLNQSLTISNIKLITIYHTCLANLTTNRLTTSLELYKTLSFPLISYGDVHASIILRLLNDLILALILAIALFAIFQILNWLTKKIKQFRGELPKPDCNNHLLALNFLRFIAAVTVVCYHLLPEAYKPYLALFPSGQLMVTFFFTLSGFVMIITHFNKIHESNSDYYKLRFARIYPLYFISIILLIKSDTNFTDICLTLLLIQSFFPGHSLAINGPGWSLSAEAFFYLIFPFFLKLYNAPPKLCQ